MLISMDALSSLDVSTNSSLSRGMNEMTPEFLSISTVPFHSETGINSQTIKKAGAYGQQYDRQKGEGQGASVGHPREPRPPF